MSNVILVIGASGSGKSTSLETLPPEETFILKVVDKDLPFRGGRKNYTPLSAGKGNTFSTYKSDEIVQTIKHISDKRPEIKNIIIDDFNYIMQLEYFDRATETGFNKFTEIALHAADVVRTAKKLRSDLNVAILAHSEVEEGTGELKIKTVGKLIDEKLSIEGLCTCVLFTEVERTAEDNKYWFITQSRGNKGKTPKGMFSELKIPNDLKLVFDTINSYYND
jgi:adenylate kinase family enzyme